jgi:hypothetical protein
VSTKRSPQEICRPWKKLKYQVYVYMHYFICRISASENGRKKVAPQIDAIHFLTVIHHNKEVAAAAHWMTTPRLPPMARASTTATTGPTAPGRFPDLLVTVCGQQACRITSLRQRRNQGVALYIARHLDPAMGQIDRHLANSRQRLQRRVDVFDAAAATHAFDVQLNTVHG